MPRHHLNADGLDRPRVLLVDPDDAARARTAQALLDGGCHVVAAVPNYAQAMVNARSHSPTVIVTELQGGQVLTPQAYVIALRRFCLAHVILFSHQRPSAGELADWGLWAAVPKGGARRLLELVHRAHESSAHRDSGMVTWRPLVT